MVNLPKKRPVHFSFSNLFLFIIRHFDVEKQSTNSKEQKKEINRNSASQSGNGVCILNVLQLFSKANWNEFIAFSSYRCVFDYCDGLVAFSSFLIIIESRFESVSLSHIWVKQLCVHFIHTFFTNGYSAQTLKSVKQNMQVTIPYVLNILINA